MVTKLNSQPINIAMVADWQYSVPVETTIKSIAFNNRNTNIYLVNPDFPREWFERINQFLTPLNDHIIDTKISLDSLQGQHVSQAHIDVMSNARLLLPQILKVDRVLFLDADLIVNKSLVKLYNADLAGHPIGAVPDIFQRSIFNAGVMVMNLKEMREQDGLVNDLLAFGSRDDLPDGDQSVMNHFFGNNHQVLPDVDNAQVGLEFNWDYSDQNSDNPVLHQKVEEMRHFLDQDESMVIIHYVCPPKPWTTTSTFRYRKLWWQYYELDWQAISSHQLPDQESIIPDALIWTASPVIYNLEQIAHELPNLSINICVPTNVDTGMEALQQIPNVHLYPFVLSHHLEMFKKSCKVMLDINQGPRNMELMRDLLDRGCPIFTFKCFALSDLSDNPNYHIFDQNKPEELISSLRDLIKN